MGKLVGAGAAFAALLVWPACESRVLEATDPGDPYVTTDTRTFAAGANRSVDILFAIDGAPTMTRYEASLRAAFPRFLKTLAALPGGLPYIHIAVVSSDMGAGMGLDPRCVGNGDRGVLQPTTDHGCDTTIAGNTRFISEVDGISNHTAPTEQVFRCLTAMSYGCGYSQPLFSLVHALGADNFDQGEFRALLSRTKGFSETAPSWPS